MEGLAGFMEDSDEHRAVAIVGSELVENYTVSGRGLCSI